MIQHLCKTCGGTLILIEEGWQCPYCKNIYKEEKVKKDTDELKKMLDDMKIEQVSNLRRNLYDAVNAEYIDSEEICRICGNIKALLPDDFAANFYYTANHDTPKQICEALRNVDSEENREQVETLVRHMLKSLHSEYVLPLQNIIENAFKNISLLKYSELTTLLSDESEKINNGIYETSVPRDVFILYSSKDIDRVMELVEYLEDNCLDCFVALRNLRHGRGSVQNYELALHEAIDNCRSVVFVSSKNSRNMGCDALKVELKYIKSKDTVGAPAEYRQNYAKIPAKYKKNRVEYRLDNEKTQPIAEKIVNEFFSGLEYVYSPESVLDRIYNFDEEIFEDEKEVVPEATSKFCISCGAENILKAKFCAECGKGEFADSKEEYFALLQKKISEMNKAEEERKQREAEEARRAEEERKQRNAEEARRAEEERKRSEIPAVRYNVGDIIKLGKYPQSNSNLKEDIEWQVLAREGNRALLISKYGLDCKVFNTTRQNVSWEGSTLRKWLNNDFLNAAFSYEESIRIPAVNLFADSGSYGSSTQDRVFLLSATETEKFLTSNRARECKPTAYSLTNGTYKNKDNGNCWWWLRSLGIYKNCAVSVNALGEIHKNGTDADNAYGSVRPALWINIDSGDGKSFNNSETDAAIKAGEERRRREAEAARKAQEDLNSRLAEAARKTEEERKRREAESARKAEEERKRREAEAIPPATPASYFDFALRTDGSYGIKIKNKSNCPAKLVLPSEYNVRKVTAIEKNAFDHCDSLKEVIIPGSIKSFDAFAFSYCESLEKVTFMNGVDSVGSYCFSSCSLLKEVKLPASLKTIESNAFSCCRTLKNISLPDGVTSIGESSFDACELINIEIPASVKKMGKNPFSRIKIKQISISNQNKNYRKESGCIIENSTERLVCGDETSIIPSGVKEIGTWAFYGNKSIKEIVIPRGVTSIGSFPFSHCDSLTKIRYNGTKSEWKSITKNSLWKDGLAVKRITCTDGEVKTGGLFG